MSPPRNLRAFLNLARLTLAAPVGQRPSPLTFVVGNESGDLDSLCSAVLFAYLRSHTAPKFTLHIPLANIPRNDLPLRPELRAALAYAGVESEDLLTLTDLLDVQNLQPEDTRWVLVDHNALTGTLAERFGSRTVGCVDHHEDENYVPTDTGDEPRVLRKTGSCMSLVIEYCRGAFEELSRQQETAENDDTNTTDLEAGLARVALGAILVDTNNLKSKAKTTELDIQIVEFLENKTKDYKRGLYYKELSELKEDISQFSYTDNFRKDFKLWKEAGMALGTCSIPQGFYYMLKHLGDDKTLIEDFQKFATERKLDIGTIMTSSAKDDGVFKRNLLVWAFNAKAVKAVEKFVEAQSDALGLAPFQDGMLDYKGEDEVRYCWYQHVTKNSRKQLAPMLRAAIREAAKL